MTTTLVIVLLPLLHAAGAADAPHTLPEGFILIAHRGVVTDTIAENSLSSLEETIRRGYTHMEVDLRCTKDGQAVCLHDVNLRRIAANRKNVHELTLEELRALVPEERAPSFETFCAKAAGRIQLMPDLKDCPDALKDAFAHSVEASLEKHKLMQQALFIGRRNIARRFHGEGCQSLCVSYEDAKKNTEEKLGGKYFAFNHASDFDAETVKEFQKLGVKVIVSINIFHYRGRDPIVRGKADVKRMLEYGVDGLQIDSVYDTILFGDKKEASE